MPGTLPTLTKTWNTATINLSVTTNINGLTSGRPVFLAIKNKLKALTNFPIAIKGSSNSVTAAMDGVDRWATESDLVWVVSTGVHSWGVWEFPQINDGAGHKLQLCADCTGNGSAVGNLVQWYASAVSGFTGGTTSLRPTAIDEIPL